MSFDELPLLMTIREAADAMHASSKTIRRLIDAGAMPVIRHRGLVRILRSDFVDTINRLRTVRLASCAREAEWERRATEFLRSEGSSAASDDPGMATAGSTFVRR